MKFDGCSYARKRPVVFLIFYAFVYDFFREMARTCKPSTKKLTLGWLEPPQRFRYVTIF